jgi:hypothetical protein
VHFAVRAVELADGQDRDAVGRYYWGGLRKTNFATKLKRVTSEEDSGRKPLY